MRRLAYCFVLPALFLLAGCTTAPETPEAKQELTSDAQQAVVDMEAIDPGLTGFVDRAYAYAAFPTVGKGALGVGGAYGKGEVFRHGNRIGYADITQISGGPQIGAEAFSELIVFENEATFNRFLNNTFEVNASLTAVAVHAESSSSTRYTDGVAVFTHPKGGLAAEVALNGQKFTYRAANPQ